MDYYDEPRQYDALKQESIKYPTRTNLVGVDKKGILSFGDHREHADVNVNVMSYHDQKEFFRLDR